MWARDDHNGWMTPVDHVRSRPVLVVRVHGGLGNQLFEFAMALHLQEVLGERVVLDVTVYERASSQRVDEPTPRAFELAGFAHGLHTIQYRTGSLFAARTIRRRLHRALLLRGAGAVRLDALLRQPEELAARFTDPIVRGASGPWFQSAAPALAVRHSLRERFALVAPRALEQERADPYVAVHCRLDDYLSERWSPELGVSDPQQLVALGHELSERHGGLPVKVFTDSPDLFARRWPPSLVGDHMIATETDAWEVLTGLARASALVMSNSTLSWWAAFTATPLAARDVEVLMPEPWLIEPSRRDQDLPVEGWSRFARRILED